MLEISNKTRVILPRWIWDKAKDKADFKRLIAKYMEKYPGYKVLELHKYYAACEIGDDSDEEELLHDNSRKSKV